MAVRVSPEQYFKTQEQPQEYVYQNNQVPNYDRTILIFGLITLGIIACVAIAAIGISKK